MRAIRPWANLFQAHAVGAALGVLFSFVVLQVAAAQAPSPLAFPVLKHRVEVLSEPLSEPSERMNVAVGVNTNVADRLPPGEETAINRQDWASALDLLKTQLAESELFRLVEPVAASTAKDPDGAGFALRAKFARRANDSVVHLRLTKKANGLLIAAATASDLAMSAAITKALRQVEKELLRLPWRCPVAENRDGKCLLPRGRLDGLRKDQPLLGYQLSAEARKDPSKSEEWLVKFHSTAQGQYKVVEVGEDYTIIAPLAGGPVLGAGDLVEIPPLKLHEERPSPDRTKWDAIYRK